ncbi:hypothetical protein FJZ27_01405 [Candidatus Peribacteria bacterium]|nr:hypothetical protein [Candidatus Peribacteria bacterium]
MAQNETQQSSDKILGFFQNPDHPTEDLLLELRRMAPDERTGVLKTVKEQLQHLEPAQRQIADDNMKLLRERVEANTLEKAVDPEQAIPEEVVVALRRELDALQRAIITPEEPKVDARAKPDAPKTDASTPAARAGAKPETWYDPTSWSPEHQQKAKDIAIVGGIIVGGAMLWHWLSKKTAAVRETVGTGASRAWSGIKWAAGITIGGVLGYLGIRSYRQLSSMSDEIEKGKAMLKKGKEELDKATEEAKAAADIAKKTTEEAKIAVDTAKKAAQGVAPPAKEAATDAKEVVQYAMLGRGLLLYYEAEKNGAGVGNEEVDRDGVAIALREMRDIKLRDIAATSEPPANPKVQAGYRFAKEVAASWLLDHPNDADQTLGALLRPMRVSMRILTNAQEIGRNSSFTDYDGWKKNLQLLFTGLSDDVGDNKEDYKAIVQELGLSESEQLPFLAYCAAHKDDPLAENDHEKFGHVFQKLAQKFSDDGAWRSYLTQYGHREKFQNELQRAELSVGEALQLSLLLQSVPQQEGKYAEMSQTNAHTAFGMQMLAASMVDRRNAALSDEMKIMLLVKAASKAGGKIDDLRLPPESLELLSKTSELVYKTVRERLGGAWNGLKNLVKYAHEENPELTDTVLTAAGLYAAPAPIRLVRNAFDRSYYNAQIDFTSNNKLLKSVAKKYGISYREARRVKDAAEAVGHAKNYRPMLGLNRMPGYGLYNELWGPKAKAYKDFKKTLDAARSRGPVTPWQKAVFGAALVAQGVGVYMDFQEYGEQQAQREAVDKQAAAAYKEVARQFSDPSKYKDLGNGIFQHKGSGVEVTVRQTKRELKKSDEVMDARVDADFYRMTSSGGFLVLEMCLGTARIAGPAGLVVAGAEAAVRIGIEAWEQGKVRSFLKDCPPWVLTTLGAQNLTGSSEYDMITKASGWMISDLYPSLFEYKTIPHITLDDKDKPEIRKKMMFALFCSDLRRYAPEVAAEIMVGFDQGPVLDRFYKEDFERIVLPSVAMKLFESTKNEGASWEAFRKGDIDSGEILSSPDVSLLELRRAMRDATVLYLQHVREKRYLDHVEKLRSDTENTGIVDPLLLELTEDLGTVSVFGKKLDDTYDDLQKNKGQTRVEVLLGRMQRRLNTVPGDTKGEKQSKSPGLFSVAATEVSGLQKDFNFADRSALLNLIDDPTTREGLGRIFAQSTKEEEGRIREQWWSMSPEGRRQRLEPPVGWDRDMDVHLARIAANNVGAPLGKKVSDDASLEETEYSVTESAIALMQEREGIAITSRDDELANDLYGLNTERPIVFSRLQPRVNVTSDLPSMVSLCKKVCSPRTREQEFDLKNVQSVAFEGKVLANGHIVVLATFVYAGPDKSKDGKPVLRIVQQGAATGATSNVRFEGSGQAIAVPGHEFLRNKGSDVFLEQVSVESEKDRPAREERAKSKAQEEARQKAQESQRMQKEKEQMFKDRADARVQAKEHPGTLFKDPEGRWYVGYHKDHGFMYIQPPDSSTDPAFTTAEAAKEAIYTFVEYKGKRYKLNPLYEQRTDISSDVLSQALAMPIPGHPEESIEKILCVFVKPKHSRERGDIMRSLLGLYSQLQTDEERRLFLSDLRARIYRETRVEGQESTEAYYLTKKMFDEKILPALIKRVSSAASERRAA